MRNWQAWQYILLIILTQNGNTVHLKKVKLGKRIHKSHEYPEKYFDLNENQMKYLDIKDAQAPGRTHRILNYNVVTVPLADIKLDNCISNTSDSTTSSIEEQDSSTERSSAGTCKVVNVQESTPSNKIQMSTVTCCTKQEDVQSLTENTTGSSDKITTTKKRRKTTTCNPDKEPNEDEEEDAEEENEEIPTKMTKTTSETNSVKLSTNPTAKMIVTKVTKSSWPQNTLCKKSTVHKPLISSVEETTDKKPIKTTKKIENTLSTKLASRCEISLSVLTTVKSTKKVTNDAINTQNFQEMANNIATTFSSLGVSTNPLPNIRVRPSIPTLLAHCLNIGTFRHIMCPILDPKSIKLWHKKQNFNTNLLQSESISGAINNESNYQSSLGASNKTDWMHYLKARLKQGNTEYDEPPKVHQAKINFRENIGKKYINKRLPSASYDQNLMNSFLPTNAFNNNEANEQQMYPDGWKGDIIKFNNMRNSKKMKSEKRHTHKDLNNYEMGASYTIDEEASKLKYEKDCDSKLEHLFSNFLRNLANNEEYIKSYNDTISELLYNDEYNFSTEISNLVDNISSTTTASIKKKLLKIKKSNEPNIQILNVTQVFNLYSKLMPLKKYLETIYANKLIATEAKKNSKTLNPLNESENNSNQLNHWVNQSEHYSAIKGMLQNYLKNLTHNTLFNDENNYLNEYNEYDTTSRQSIFKNHYNTYFNDGKDLKKQQSIEVNNKRGLPRAKFKDNASNYDNDIITSVIRDIIERAGTNKNEMDNVKAADSSSKLNKDKWISLHGSVHT